MQECFLHVSRNLMHSTRISFFFSSELPHRECGYGGAVGLHASRPGRRAKSGHRRGDGRIPDWGGVRHRHQREEPQVKYCENKQGNVKLAYFAGPLYAWPKRRISSWWRPLTEGLRPGRGSPWPGWRRQWSDWVTLQRKHTVSLTINVLFKKAATTPWTLTAASPPQCGPADSESWTHLQKGRRLTLLRR